VKSVKISVPALMVFLTGQTRGLKSFRKLKNVRNVRKWPNLCSIKP